MKHKKGIVNSKTGRTNSYGRDRAATLIVCVCVCVWLCVCVCVLGVGMGGGDD